MSNVFRKKSNVFEKISHVFWKISHVFVERSEYSFYGSEFIEIALRIFEIIGFIEIIEILSDSSDFMR